MDFDTAIERVFALEGGLADLAGDPGGLTKYGISQRSYPDVDIVALTKDEAKAIYRRDFWEKCHAEKLHPFLAFQALDFAVNSGCGTAIRKLQAAAGVADDGYWGPVTAAAVAAANPAALVCRYLAERLDFMRRLSTWKLFGAGWAARIAADLRHAATDIEAGA